MFNTANLLLLLAFSYFISAFATSNTNNAIMIIGSINADIIVPFYGKRFPGIGETIVTNHDDDSCGRVIPGGKGANQAVSCSRLGSKSYFICQFGDDYNAKILENTMINNKVDLSHCEKVNKPSGLGLVFLQDQGSVSAIVVGGSNAVWPSHEILMNKIEKIFQNNITTTYYHSISCIMLQMEIPQYVNELIAEYAFKNNIPVFQDIGGEEREISTNHLKRCTFISPNLTELKRLTNRDIVTEDDVINAAKYLQSQGASNVLVTLGSNGSLLLLPNGDICKQPCYVVDEVIDETGAGDNYRAAFVVAYYIEKKSIQESMEYASIAGAIAVTKMGAIPACTTKEECMNVLNRLHSNKIFNIKGGHTYSSSSNTNKEYTSDDEQQVNKDHNKRILFPYKFASRLNSMKDRIDLCLPSEVNNNNNNNSVLGWISRQGRIKGLDLIDFNYPQHITSHIVTNELKDELMKALKDAGLECGAICLRYPKSMQAGAFTNPNLNLRKEALQLTKEACDWAIALNAKEVVVWSAFDGYDYSLQCNYHTLWDYVVQGFQEVCDTYPTLKISLEYKPTDENTRFFAIPSTGSAQILANEVNRNNFGLTLDFGHCLMAGENPAQSVAYVNRNGNKLYGVQLGDGYGRLGAEDGLAFGSVHSKASLEFVYWLIKTNYSGHIYFDTFPRNEDPIRECEYNIRQFKRMYDIAKKMIDDHKLKIKVDEYLKNHDAMSMLELIEQLSSLI